MSKPCDSPTHRVCILVLGMHRSGTSAVTRTISGMGAALPGNLIPPLKDNPEGFWESADIVAVHNRFLEAVGSAWNDPRILAPEVFETNAAAVCREELLSILQRDFSDQRLFVIKDPRICVLMPLWLRVLADFEALPLAVFAYRHPAEVALSLTRRNEAIREHGLALWLTCNLMAERQTRGLRRLFVSYDGFLADPIAAARRLADGLGCFDAAKVAVGLELARTQWRPEMRNHATADDSSLPAWVRTIYDWLRAATRPGAAEPSVADLETLALAIADAHALYGPMIGAALPRPQRRPALSERVARRLSSLGRPV